MSEIKLDNETWQYDPNARLGLGAFGSVFRGNSRDGEAVAIKVVRWHRRARREIDISKVVKAHPGRHIMPVLDSGLDVNALMFGLVMPIADCSLKDRLDDLGTLGSRLDVVMQIAMGISELPGVAHRDLKPSNILRHLDAWKISDFGISRVLDRATTSGTVRGLWKQEYSAPEQWKSERATTKTDLYALGCIAFEVIANRLPFDGRNRHDWRDKHLNELPPPLGCRQDIDDLVAALLRKRPETRPNVGTVIEVLVKAISQCKG